MARHYLSIEYKQHKTTMKSTELKNSTPVRESNIRIKHIGGQDTLNVEDIQAWLCSEIAKLPRETRPVVLAAEDARSTINELTYGIGGEMEKFRSDAKKHLEDLRGLKFSVVSELVAMKKELVEVRTFFHGSDHEKEMARLKDFVDLCERMQALKASGVLDALADTMLKLA